MARDSSDWASEITEMARNAFFKGNEKAPGEISQRVDDLIRTVAQEAKKTTKANAGWGTNKVNEHVLKQSDVSQLASELKQAIHRFDKAYQDAKDHRKQLAKIEHGQGFRRVIWRAASTASVAAVILCAWAIAQHYGIHLPLMRVAG
ncbi:hypothetical protein [Marinobacter sp. NFXS9]|uniref:hypothetical protein n=1 Tax=Marinobacter sp. NFXS9 TaxID=2818433 RepID=UPI0032DE505C